MGVALLLVLGGVYLLRGVLTPIFTALGIAYLLDPVVDRFEARGLPRGAGITIVLATLTVAIALFGLLVLPGVIREVAQFAAILPDELSALLSRLEPTLRAYDVPLPHSISEAIAQLDLDPATIASYAAQPATSVVRGVLGGTASIVGALASALIVPVLAFYLLYDFDRGVEAARELIPLRIRAEVVEIASEIDEMLGQFVRGQLLVMIAMAILYAIAYSLVGIRLAIPIALVAGLLAFIPYVGSGSALVLGLTMCVIDWDGWTKPVLVVIAYAVCQFLEGFVIVPRVVGEKVGLASVWVLVALMIGGEVFGFLGVLLAVPVAAVVKILVVRGVAWYRASPYYLGDEAPSAGAALVEGVVDRIAHVDDPVPPSSTPPPSLEGASVSDAASQVDEPPEEPERMHASPPPGASDARSDVAEDGHAAPREPRAEGDPPPGAPPRAADDEVGGGG